MEFSNCKLRNILIAIHSGGTPSTSIKDYWGGPYKWLSSGETGQRFISDTIDTITERGIKESSTKLAKRGSIVMACAGQGKTRGQTSFLLDDMYVNQSVIVLNPDTNKVLPLYLFYDLSRRYEELRGGSDASSTRGSITTASLKTLPFQYPTIQDQQTIVSILYAYDQMIEVNNKRIKVLEQMAENLYKEWFVRFRFPGHETAEFENGIPKGWSLRRLKDYGHVETGKTPSMEVAEYYGDDYLFIKTPEMHGNIFVIDTQEKLSERGHQTQPTKLLPVNSIMVTCIGTGGVVAINAAPGHTNQQINSIILDDLNYLEWLFFVCKSMRATIEMFGATGSTMTNLSKGKFEKLKVIEPPAALIMKYHNIISPILSEIEDLMVVNQKLIKQRDLLLPRLMNGKLEV